MEVGDSLTGFVVDAVAEVIRISSAEIQPAACNCAGKRGPRLYHRCNQPHRTFVDRARSQPFVP